jgi:catechol 2,3-dioxygenase-like lactoylglutathione lyase family enzyme
MSAVEHIVAPNGSPLAAALISVENLEASIDFWVGRVGFEPVGEIQAASGDWNALWGLPRNTPARFVLLRANGMAVGQLLLVEWDVPGRQRIRANEDTQAYGLQNVNCYVENADAGLADLVAAGGRPWSPPTRHEFGPAVGAPIEVVAEVVDGVALNLVELTSRDPAQRIGQMRAYVAGLGYTSRGFTPVVTSSHVVRTIDAGVAFYRDVLGMGVLIDDELKSDEANGFLRLPRGSRTRVTFVQGVHMFGKIAMSGPLNYECDDLTPRAHAPNVGYLAQVFEVKDLAAARAAAARLGAKEEGAAELVDVAGFGERGVLLVRHPASGAPILILSRR